MASAETLHLPGLAARSFDSLLEEAVRFHGHECPGQVLGVRMVLAGCRAIRMDEPRGSTISGK
jgi:formylmethanofuran dehydrogenase subunit E